MKKRALLITNIATPFQVELAEDMQLTDECEWNLDIWVKSDDLRNRGDHWKAFSDSKFVYLNENQKKEGYSFSLSELLETHEYEFIVSGLRMSIENALFLKKTNSRNIPVILWAEPPMPRTILINLLKLVNYKIVGIIIKPRAIFAIGSLARRTYKKAYTCPVNLVPYYQNHSYQQLSNSKKSNNIVKFIFSGQLIKRNNIENILKAIELLSETEYREKFTVTFFGDGELLKSVQEKYLLYPSNIKINDKPILAWEDRLTPLKESDVLLSPSQHAGWGLTIPEALALGMPVISTTNVSSSEHLIKEGINGLICDAEPVSISLAMSYFIENTNVINKMKQQCIDSTLITSTKEGSKVFSRLFDLYKI